MGNTVTHSNSARPSLDHGRDGSKHFTPASSPVGNISMNIPMQGSTGGYENGSNSSYKQGYSMPGSVGHNMVGSMAQQQQMDDGTLESKVKAMVAPEGGDFVPTVPDVAVDPVTTVFRWGYGGIDVAVTGNFQKWKGKIDAVPFDKNEFVAAVSLQPGTYQYRYIVDGQWKIDPFAPQMVVNGILCNIVEVQPPVVENIVYNQNPENDGEDQMENSQIIFGQKFPSIEDYASEAQKIPLQQVHQLPQNQDYVKLEVPSHVILNHVTVYTPSTNTNKNSTCGTSCSTTNTVIPQINTAHPNASEVHVPQHVLDHMNLADISIVSTTQRLKASKGIRLADRYITTILVAPKTHTNNVIGHATDIDSMTDQTNSMS